jgi:hypothetical protein
MRRPSSLAIQRPDPQVVGALLLAILLTGCGPATVPSPTVAPVEPTTGFQSSMPASAPPTRGATLGGSVPPTSDATWQGLDVASIADGPVGIDAVVTWSGGVLAFDATGDSGPMRGWLSRDGRSWIEVPAGTFGAEITVLAAASGDVLVAIAEGAAGTPTEYRSTDGVAWTASTPVELGSLGPVSLAGGSHGFVAVIDGVPDHLVFSRDGETWAVEQLPGTGTIGVGPVAAVTDGFVAVGDVTSAAADTDAISVVSSQPVDHPAAWLSVDGMTWSPATIAHPLEGGFVSVAVGRGGLVAIAASGGAPGLATFWQSPDGRSWTPSSGDPFGVVANGEGLGSVRGEFWGDGTRILGYDTGSDGSELQLSTSVDSVHWTRLALGGALPDIPAYDLIPFLLRDGILIAAPRMTWLGQALP